MCITKDDADFFVAVFNKALHNCMDRRARWAWPGEQLLIGSNQIKSIIIPSQEELSVVNQMLPVLVF